MLIKRFFSSIWSLVVVGFLLAILIFLLYTANPVLNKLLVPSLSLPYGTVIAWLALILFPLWSLLFFQQTTPLLSQIFQLLIGRLIQVALFLGVFWGLISYYLAENWQFSFTPALANQDERAKAFWLVSASIPIVTLIALLATAIAIGLFWIKKHMSK